MKFTSSFLALFEKPVYSREWASLCLMWSSPVLVFASVLAVEGT